MEYGYVRYLREEGDPAFHEGYRRLRVAGIAEDRIFGDGVVMPGDRVHELWDCVASLASGDRLLFACGFSLAPEIGQLGKLMRKIEKRNASVAVLDAEGHRLSLSLTQGWLGDALGFLEDWERRSQACEKALIARSLKPRIVRPPQPRAHPPPKPRRQPEPVTPPRPPKKRGLKPKERVWTVEMIAYAHAKRHRSSMPLEDICDALRTTEEDYARYLNGEGALTAKARALVRAAAASDGRGREPPLETLGRQRIRHRVLTRFSRKGGA